MTHDLIKQVNTNLQLVISLSITPKLMRKRPTQRERKPVVIRSPFSSNTFLFVQVLASFSSCGAWNVAHRCY